MLDFEEQTSRAVRIRYFRTIYWYIMLCVWC